MKLIYIITFSILSLKNYSQKSGNVLYTISPIEFQIKENTLQKDLGEEIITAAGSQTFTLDFTDTGAKFYQNITLTSDSEARTISVHKIANVRFTCNYIYYLDKSNQAEYFHMDNTAIIKDIYTPKSWEITTETKTIHGYLCYKAVYKYDYKARDGQTKTNVVTAWFAPELPFGYGPKNYNNLPGLILELNEKETTFLASKITLSDTDVKINFPKGKSVTREEYEQKVLSGMTVK